jgi:hypothetical protein
VGVERDASVPKLGMAHARFVFLALFDPQLDGRVTVGHTVVLWSSAVRRVSRVRLTWGCSVGAFVDDRSEVLELAHGYRHTLILSNSILFTLRQMQPGSASWS